MPPRLGISEKYFQSAGTKQTKIENKCTRIFNNRIKPAEYGAILRPPIGRVTTPAS